MADDLLVPEDEGFFAWLSRPRRVVTNLMAGRPGGAARQAADFLLNIPDAFIPGDVIPELSGPDDDLEAGDVLGMHNGIAKTVVDIGVGAVLDPLSWTPIAPALKAVRAAGKAAGAAAPVVGKAATVTRNLVADTLNWHDMSPSQRTVDVQARARGRAAEHAAMTRARDILRGTDQTERTAVYDAVQGVVPDQSGAWVPLPGQQPLERLLAHPDYRTADQASKRRMEQLLRDAVRLGDAEWSDLNLWSHRPLSGVPGYIQRVFDLDEPGVAALHARSIKSPADLARELNADPKLSAAYRRDLDLALFKRASEQGRIAARQAIGEAVLPQVPTATAPNGAVVTESFDIREPSHRTALRDRLVQMQADPQTRDFATRALAMVSGKFQMDPVSEALAAFNRTLFKPAATVGVVVPHVAFMVRNSLSAIAQALATPGARGAALRDPRWVAQRVVGGVADAVDQAVFKATGQRIIPDEVNAVLNALDEAFKAGKGSVHDTRDYLHRLGTPAAQRALEALDLGVLHNAVNMDDLMASIKPGAPFWRKAAKEVWEFPAALNEHVENRMRVGLFLAASKAGQSPAAAAESVRNALLDYSVPTVANRVFRTWIPFGAFLSQTVKQHGKLFVENFADRIQQGGTLAHGVSSALAGGVARGLATEIFEEDPQNPLMPDMVGRMAFSLGYTPEGKHRYVASLGLPIEALGDIPQSFVGREWERLVGSATSPLVKSAYAWMSGRDPFWGTPYGSYDRPYAALEALGMEEGLPAARLRQLAGTGAIQPLAHFLRLAEPWLDDAQGAGLDALRAFTGVRVRDVDESLAARLQLEEALRANPYIRQYTGLYAEHADDETQDLLRRYERLKARIRAARQAASAASAADGHNRP